MRKERRPSKGMICKIKVRDKRDKSPSHLPARRSFADQERFCSEIRRAAVSVLHLVRPVTNGTISLPTG
jgi:hypothetical protein